MAPRLLIILAILVVLPCPTDTFGATAQQERYTDKSVAGLSIGTDTVDSVERLYGAGVRQENPFGTVVCYRDEQHRVLLLVSMVDDVVRSVTISALPAPRTEPSCRERVLRMTDLKTGKGIRLGDPQSRVRHIYGKPHSIRHEATRTVLVYETDLTKSSGVDLFYRATLTFERGRLVALTIADVA